MKKLNELNLKEITDYSIDSFNDFIDYLNEVI